MLGEGSNAGQFVEKHHKNCLAEFTLSNIFCVGGGGRVGLEFFKNIRFLFCIVFYSKSNQLEICLNFTFLTTILNFMGNFLNAFSEVFRAFSI